MLQLTQRQVVVTVTPNVALDKYYLIAGFALQGVHRTQRILTLPSGKGLNVARVLHRCGVPAVSTGVVAGFTGRHICSLLDKAHQQHHFVWAEGESRLCITITDPAQEVHTEILESGPAYTAEVEAELEASVYSLAQTSMYVAICGSPPEGTASDILNRLVCKAQAAGARVLLDARGEWLKKGIQAIPSIVKPNWQEFQEVVGFCVNQQVAVERARQLVDKGIDLLLITMGAAGALAVTSFGAWRIVPPQVHAVSCVGCGDAMAGGLLAALARNWPLPESLRYATAVAAANACELGAGEFQPDKVGEFLAQVTIEPLQ